MSGYVEIVNWDATRRHYATQAWVEWVHEGMLREEHIVPKRDYADIPGLCGKVYGRTIEWDRMLREERIVPKRDYAALPLCKFCERKATP